MNQLILNLASFASLLSKDNRIELNYWRDIIKIYESSVGGCNCSKKAREQNAANYFVVKINNTNIDTIKELKVLLNADKISFQDSNEIIFLEV